MSLYNKLMLEEMHRKVDGLGRLAASLRARGPIPVGDKAAAAAAVAQMNAAAGRTASDVKPAISDVKPAVSDPKSAAEAGAEAAMKGWADVLAAPAPAPPAQGGAGEAQTGVSAIAEGSARNRDRTQNIFIFFAVYAGFKYLADSNVWP